MKNLDKSLKRGEKFQGEVYDALMLVNDIREELQKIVDSSLLHRGRLSDKKLSKLLGQVVSYIFNMKQAIKRDSAYQISLDMLDEFEYELRCKFGNKSENVINFIKKYRSLNDLKKGKEQVYRHHPKLVIDFFKKIDTKEKAYWLGFLYADGYFERIDQYVTRIGIEISVKDEVIIDRFIKAISLNKEYKDYTKKNSVYIRFACKKMVDDLKNMGLKDRKSKILELPKLDNRELYLAFLLGFFDGDGREEDTLLFSGSKTLLEQIKELFEISSEVKPSKPNLDIDEKGQAFYLILGAELFNEMMDNYEESLERKRKKLMTSEQRRELLAKMAEQKKKFSLSKEDLQKLVWEMPRTKIAEKLGFAYSTVCYWIDKLQINTPNRGYWHQRQIFKEINNLI